MSIGPQILSLLFTVLDSDIAKEALAEALDFIEERIEKSETKVDDKLLPLIELTRRVYELPARD